MDHPHTPENTPNDESTRTEGPTNLGRPIHPEFEPLQPMPPREPSRALLCLATAGVFLVGFGVFRSLTVTPQTGADHPTVETVRAERQPHMPNAVETARRTPHLQREHIEQMPREMTAADDGTAGFEHDGD